MDWLLTMFEEGNLLELDSMGKCGLNISSKTILTSETNIRLVKNISPFGYKIISLKLCVKNVF